MEIETIRTLYALDLAARRRRRLVRGLLAVVMPIVAYLAMGDEVRFIAAKMVSAVGGV